MKLPDDLYSYQKEDLERILGDDGSWLVLSEMGTGKTPLSLGVSELGNFKGKTLILCPKTLQLEWKRQILEWCGIDPSVAKKSAYRRLETLFDEFITGKKSPYFITNIETLRTKRHMKTLQNYPFGMIVVDEAHQLRNPSTAQTKGAFKLFESHPTAKKLLLTGSPIVNNPADLHTLLCLAKPEEYSTRLRRQFVDNYCYYTRKRDGGIKILGARNLGKLREKTDYFTVRRTKQEVLPFLPEKYYRKVLLEMEDDQADIYNKMKKDLMVMLDEGEPVYAASVLAQLTRLRQINLDPEILGLSSSSSKVNFLFDFMEEMGIGENKGKKLVVFSCFESFHRRLSQRLRSRDINHVMVTGKVDSENRMEAVRRFQEDDKTEVILGTLQTMGVGVTLTAASDCVFMDRWWNPAINNQGADRLHRIGQKNAVQIVLPINDKTIDASLERVLLQKAKYSQEYLNDQDVMREVVDDMREQFRVEDHLIYKDVEEFTNANPA